MAEGQGKGKVKRRNVFCRTMTPGSVVKAGLDLWAGPSRGGPQRHVECCGVSNFQLSRFYKLGASDQPPNSEVQSPILEELLKIQPEKRGHEIKRRVSSSKHEGIFES